MSFLKGFFPKKVYFVPKKVSVVLRVRLPLSTKQNDEIFVAGNFNDWDTGKTKLTRQSNRVAVLTFPSLEGTTIHYYYTHASTEVFNPESGFSYKQPRSLVVSKTMDTYLSQEDHVIAWSDTPKLIAAQDIALYDALHKGGSSPYYQAEKLVEIALALAEYGNDFLALDVLSDVQNITDTLQPGNEKKYLFQKIARIYMALDQCELAAEYILKWLHLGLSIFETDLRQIEALCQYARQVHELHEKTTKDDLMQIIERDLSTCNDIGDLGTKAKAFVTLAHSYNMIGATQKARELMMQVVDAASYGAHVSGHNYNFYSAYNASSIALRCALLGEQEDCRQILNIAKKKARFERPIDGPFAAAVWTKIAAGYVAISERGYAEEALSEGGAVVDFIGSIDGGVVTDEDSREISKLAIAREYVRLGDLSKAEVLFKEVENMGDQYRESRERYGEHKILGIFVPVLEAKNAYLNLANTYFDLGWNARAKTMISQEYLRWIGPDSVYYYGLRCAQTLSLDERPSFLEQLLPFFIADKYHKCVLLIEIGYCYGQIENVVEAKRALERALNELDIYEDKRLSILAEIGSLSLMLSNKGYLSRRNLLYRNPTSEFYWPS